MWTKDTPAKIVEDYSRSLRTTILDRHVDASEQNPVVESMNLRRESFLLDAGCGTGRYLANAVPGQKFVGMDLSIEMLKATRQSLGRGMYVVGELERLPFKAGVFNEVISIRVLQHIRNQGNAIGEMARVCRSGGDVVVLSHNSWTLHCLYKNIRMDRRGLRAIIDFPFRLILGRRSVFGPWSFEYDNYCSMPELAGMFERAGLRVTEKKGGTFGAPWILNFFYLQWALERIAPFLLKAYLGMCAWLERRLDRTFPFTYILMDKLILKGVKPAGN